MHETDSEERPEAAAVGREFSRESKSQVVKADGDSRVSNVAQSQLSGDIIDSVVVTAGGNVFIGYPDGRSEPLDESSLMRRYAQAIIQSERFNRWADEKYINGTICTVPVNVPPRAWNQPGYETGGERDLVAAVNEELAQGKIVLLLGEPGAGKTTALERLMYVYANRAMSVANAPLPLMVRLNLYDGGLERLIQAAFNELGKLQLSAKQAGLLARNARILVLFDGLNELGKWHAEGVRAVQSFIAANPAQQYVVTCRTQDYNNDLRVAKGLEVQPFDKQDVKRYLEAHLGDAGIELYSQIRKEEKLMRLLRLAHNPLLLRMLKDSGVTGKLPRNRGELYRDFIRKILWREERKGGHANSIPGLVKERALSQLAYQMQIDNELHCRESRIRDSFSGYLRDWEEPYNWRELLEEVKSNGLLRPTASEWSFTHQSFQEYFAAYALEESNLPEPILTDITGRREWNEVLYLLSGITQHSSRLVASLLASDPFMAAKSVSHGASPDEQVLELLIDAIGERSNDRNWAVRRTCADLLGELGSPLAHPHLTRLSQDNNYEVRWGAVHAFRLIGTAEDAVRALVKSLDDPYWVTQGEAAMALGEMGAVETVPQIGALLDSGSAYVRASATYALIRLSISPSSPATAELLRSPSKRVRVLADFAIRVSAHENQDAFVRKSLRDESPLVREAAVMLLVRAKKFHTAQAIARLLTDNVPSVRAAALVGLGKLQARDFISEIASLMLQDGDGLVRESAASALDSMHAREAYPDFLLAANDASSGVRKVVARSLGRLGIEEGRPVLRRLAESDPSTDVRVHAIRALGFLGSQDDSRFLRSMLSEGLHSDVTEAIQEALENILSGNRRLRF